MNHLSRLLPVCFFFLIPYLAFSQLTGITKFNNTTYKLRWENNQTTFFDFYGNNIVRIFQDTTGKMIKAPDAKPEAKILVDNPKREVPNLNYKTINGKTVISTTRIKVIINNDNGTFSITNIPENKKVVEVLNPVEIENGKTTLTLKENPDEYFFGGGVQNGRFSHKGKKIEIVNENSWTDGGVSSPAPFYWSTNGYAFMWHTFKPGQYDFGSTKEDTITLSHQTGDLDVFFMIDDSASALLNDYYQLTGHPILITKFGFYEGHLNAYNRDYWKEDSAGILFEDGKRYKESQKDNGGIKESLNGEKNNYQFSARAVIDRYKRNDMPLGWFLPNDGYGAGYGQAGTLDSNIMNLENFGNYARKNGVQIGLWTQSDLHPKPEIPALLQRDLVKEVGVAGVRILKTDVAWVGAGYSFGLHGIEDAAGIMKNYGHDARPFIITLDGWAGTQRYGTIWTGDQAGGQWEYIRFHIPTYIGAGLSGLPNITSDMDGIFGGKNPVVNARDFEWKTFTPMQLNMDGWGSNPKDPFALGEPTTSINRTYLKWKSELIPYSYSIAHEAVSGLPMIRAMFLVQPNAYTLGINTQYQFMYGPYFLIAPIYQNTNSDSDGNDIRNNIYLPDGKWIDYFSGEEYEGNQTINNFNSPVWKLPVFIKRGAIIPLANPNNHISEINPHLRIYEIYPYQKSQFTEYNDDGTTEEYTKGKFSTTLIESDENKGQARVIIHPAKGNFNGFEKMKSTQIRINATQKPKKIVLFVNNKKIKIKEVKSLNEFNSGKNCFYYDKSPELNQFATRGSSFSKVSIIKNPIVYVNIETLDISKDSIILQLDGYDYNPLNSYLKQNGSITPPSNFIVSENNSTAYTITPQWNKVKNADYYEIEFQNMLYSTIRDTNLKFENLSPETFYHFKLRSVNKYGHSDWVALTATTKKDPFQFAIRDIRGYSSALPERGESLYKFFDFDSTNMWHTRWDTTATPFQIIIDLRSINQLDKLLYLPRLSGKNGNWQKGNVEYSMDKNHWMDAGNFNWTLNGETKEFIFSGKPIARYLKINILEAGGKFGSGRELYIFKVPGSESFLPGDINQDGAIDNNDLTSYMNYNGLKKGDADFEGYISKGDLNQNGIIDAYDISNVAAELDGGVKSRDVQNVEGSISFDVHKRDFKKGEIINIVVKGKDLKNVNAFSFAIPYNKNEYEFIGLKSLNVGQLQDFTYDRLHSDGGKVLYPTFVNIGNKKTLNGNHHLFIIQFKARKNLRYNLKDFQGILVGKDLSEAVF